MEQRRVNTALKRLEEGRGPGTEHGAARSYGAEARWRLGEGMGGRSGVFTRDAKSQAKSALPRKKHTSYHHAVSTFFHLLGKPLKLNQINH